MAMLDEPTVEAVALTWFGEPLWPPAGPAGRGRPDRAPPSRAALRQFGEMIGTSPHSPEPPSLRPSAVLCPKVVQFRENFVSEDFAPCFCLVSHAALRLGGFALRPQIPVPPPSPFRKRWHSVLPASIQGFLTAPPAGRRRRSPLETGVPKSGEPSGPQVNSCARRLRFQPAPEYFAA